MKTTFHKKNLALRLALKRRQTWTRRSSSHKSPKTQFIVEYPNSYNRKVRDSTLVFFRVFRLIMRKKSFQCSFTYHLYCLPFSSMQLQLLPKPSLMTWFSFWEHLDFTPSHHREIIHIFAKAWLVFQWRRYVFQWFWDLKLTNILLFGIE